MARIEAAKPAWRHPRSDGGVDGRMCCNTMKKTWLLIAMIVAGFVLLGLGCHFASNQRVMNRLNPVSQVEGQVLSERGTPIPGVELKMVSSIGYYPVGRILEQSAIAETDIIKSDTNGFFRIRKRCSNMIIRVNDAKYEIIEPKSGAGDDIFIQAVSSFDMAPTANNVGTDVKLKVILRTKKNDVR